MTPVSRLSEEGLKSLAAEANEFLTAFRWCHAVKESFLAVGVDGVIGVFLFQIEPAVQGVDETLWVIVGDLPPAYLVCEDAPDWQGALRCYVCEMRKWVEAVRAGATLDEIIPVEAEPTLEHANMLALRLDFIQHHMVDRLPCHEEESP